ncbi:MAG: penicillin-binding protein, partial [Eubacteriaceae bacterium]|nr:penicillin-binding protein [Eubacteriaceae bacterium]
MSVKEKKGIKRKKKKRHILVTILLILLVLALVGGGFMYSIYAANRMDITDYEYTAKDKTYVYSSDNVVIAELYIRNRTNVTIDQIPIQMQQALVAVEDSRFYSHSGIDPIGIVRAFFSNVLN